MISQQMASRTVRPFTAAPSKPTSRVTVACSAHQQRDPWRIARDAGAAALFSATLLVTQPAFAELNKFEEEIAGEFGTGTALQFGEADIKGRDFSDQDLRRSNFTSADLRTQNWWELTSSRPYYLALTLKMQI